MLLLLLTLIKPILTSSSVCIRTHHALKYRSFCTEGRGADAKAYFKTGKPTKMIFHFFKFVPYMYEVLVLPTHMHAHYMHTVKAQKRMLDPLELEL